MWQCIDRLWCLFHWDFGAIRLSTGTGSSSVLIRLKISCSEWSQGSALIRANLAPEQGGVKTCRPPLTWWPLPHPSVNSQHPSVWTLEASIPHLRAVSKHRGVDVGKGYVGEKLRGGCSKGHTQNFLSSPLIFLHFLLPSSSPSLSLLWPPRSSAPSAWSRLFTLLEREGPEQGQWRLSESLSTPWLSKEVCKGASQHPFHKLHSLLPHFLPTLTCLTHTHLVSLSTTDIPECCSEIRTVPESRWYFIQTRALFS